MDVNTPKKGVGLQPTGSPCYNLSGSFVPFPLHSNAGPGVVLFGSSGGILCLGFVDSGSIGVRRASVLEHSDGESQINKVIITPAEGVLCQGYFSCR